MSEVQLFIIETQVELERIFSYNNPRRGKASIKNPPVNHLQKTSEEECF